MNRVYMCIDLKSFYASVECRERNLNPLTTNLVVADGSRTNKTICLAVSPSLKQYGISGRARLFEVVSTINKVNSDRLKCIRGKFRGKSYDDDVIKKRNDIEIDYIVATPRMYKYMEYSTKIYNIYLKYLSSDDIHVYSIDEVFCDITDYLSYYNMSARELVTKIIQDVYDNTGITATAGIGTNLYLCKIAMDIVAKKMKPNGIGVRIAGLDEMSYRKLLWNHTPLTDFWRVGKGYAKRLSMYNIYTMGDIARCSIENEDLLYRLFGVNAELLIDHAWGYESCTIKDIKSYKPSSNSISMGQVLHSPYNYDKTKVVVKEMADSLSLDLVSKGLVCEKIVLDIGYDVDNLSNSSISNFYDGEVVVDRYGRDVPKPCHGSVNLECKTSSSSIIIREVSLLFDRIVNKRLLCRRITLTACDVTDEKLNTKTKVYKQFDLFSDNSKVDKKYEIDKKKEKDEKKLQHTIIDIKSKYGKNAILKGMNFEEGATMRERNLEVGGHKG